MFLACLISELHWLIVFESSVSLNSSLLSIFFIKPVETSLEDPCFHPGYSEKKSVKNVFDTPCVHTINKEDMDKSFTHNGTGNFTECQSSIMKVFNFSQCTNSRCSFNGVYQPPIEGTFGVRPISCLHSSFARL